MLFMNEELKKCYNQALAHLARKDYSEYKLKQKLKDKGYEREVIAETINELLEKNYLREDLYIEARVKGFLRKGYSYDVIRYRLSQEFCEASLEEIENIAHEIGLTKDAQLKDLVEKKVRIDYDFVPNKQKLRDRVLRYAGNRGHSISKAASYYDQVIEEFYS